MTRRKKIIPGLSFSWKRASGLSTAKGNLSKQIGIPLTQAGRQRKFGKVSGCCVLAVLIIGVVGSGIKIYWLATLFSIWW